MLVISDMDDPRRSLLGRSDSGRQQAEESAPVQVDDSQTQRQRYLQMAFVGAVIVSVAISLIISIYRGVVVSGLYFMLVLSLIGFVIVEICMIMFIRSGDLPSKKGWFLYFVGGCIILESVFTDILIMQ